MKMDSFFGTNFQSIFGAISILALGCISCQSAHAGTIENQRRLVNKLFTQSVYNKLEYPVGIPVELGLSLISLNLNGIRSNKLQTHVLLRQKWVDPRLEWNPADFGNQSLLSLSSDQVWKPNIKLLNSATIKSLEDSCALTLTTTSMVVDSSGEVLLATPCNFETTCNLSAISPEYSVPKMCSLKFGNWAWDGIELQIYKNQSTVDLTLFEDLTDWEVTETTAELVVNVNGGYNETLPNQVQFHFYFNKKHSQPGGNFSGSIPLSGSALKVVSSDTVDCNPGSKKGLDGTCQESVDFI